jgi:membrane protein insertase Oxa1/YidC/SpoIIIJ
MAGMTYLFPGFTFIVGLSLPAALSLYWTAGSIMAVFQQYFVLRRDVEELEEGVLVTSPKSNAKLGSGKAKGKG